MSEPRSFANSIHLTLNVKNRSGRAIRDKKLPLSSNRVSEEFVASQLN